MSNLLLRARISMAMSVGLWALAVAGGTPVARAETSPVDLGPGSVREAAWSASVETDPIFYVAALPNGPAFDLNVDFRVRALPHLRFGLLGWSGRWSGRFSEMLLTEDFVEDDWIVHWSGVGAEAQYQISLGFARGGLLLGTRFQWNNFRYDRDTGAAAANHLAMTPQVGFQWFPFRDAGFYLLPWAGAQIPIVGTRRVALAEPSRDTRKTVPIATVHIGWEF
jgi:dihydroflavonol-4-reductase